MTGIQQGFAQPASVEEQCIIWGRVGGLSLLSAVTKDGEQWPGAWAGGVEGRPGLHPGTWQADPGDRLLLHLVSSGGTESAFLRSPAKTHAHLTFPYGIVTVLIWAGLVSTLRMDWPLCWSAGRKQLARNLNCPCAWVGWEVGTWLVLEQGAAHPGVLQPLCGSCLGSLEGT